MSFRSVKPAGYPIPVDGPVGDLLRAQGRHNMRPAHLHFLAYKPGYKTLVSQIYPPDDNTSIATCSSASPDICWANLSVTIMGGTAAESKRRGTR